MRNAAATTSTATADDTLEPKLTKWDERVLSKLGDWPENRAWPSQPLPWMDVWDVAKALREDNVAEVRRTLDGLAHLHYAIARGWSWHRRWIRATWAREREFERIGVFGGNPNENQEA